MIIKGREQRVHTDNSENLNEDDNSINQPVPCFPDKKTPSYQDKLAQLSSNSSTKDSSFIFAHDSEPSIASLNSRFKSAQGKMKLEIECQLIKRLVNLKPQQGKSHYLLDGVWALRYTQYLYDNLQILPGPIDNSRILHTNNLIFNKDYFMLNESVWLFLKEQYGGGPEIVYDSLPQAPKSQCSINEERSKSADISMVSNFSRVSDIHIPIVGLKNELFYCYMNATLQCLMCLPQLNDYFLNLQQLKQICSKPLYDKLFTCRLYQEMLYQLKSHQGENQKLQGIRSIFARKFNPKYQHDSQEFLLYLFQSIDEELQYLNKELNKQNKKCYNIIELLFKGLIQQEIICKNCKSKSKIQEEFLTLSLAIQKVNSVNQAIEEFFKDELIPDYHCEKCNKTKSSIKRTRIVKLPQYLILHLKRFKYFPKQNKLIQQIKFGIETIFFNVAYKLIGVIVHQGSLDQGHYYSFGKRQGKWYLFNDQKTKQVNKYDVSQQQAYMLIYQQQ